MTSAASSGTTDRRSLVLGLSSRVSWPAMSVTYEMDDSVRRFESADFLSVDLRIPQSIRVERLARNAIRLPNWRWLAGRLREQERLPGGYDVLFAGVMSFRDLWVLAGADLPTVATKRICFIDEVWVPDLHHFDMYRDVLEQFDVVYTSSFGTIPALSALTSVPVRWLPSATDALVRCPADDQIRCVDVHSVGRRCPVQHTELLDAARRRHIVYQFDSLSAAALSDWSEHRFSLAEQARRSRFYVCHRAKFDDAAETGGVQEFGGRFFDAMAAGSIPIGDLPDDEHFRNTFPRLDAMVNQPSGAPGIVETLDKLGRDDDRLRSIARANAAEALSNHDWVHRWASMLSGVGLELERNGEARRTGLEAVARAMIDGNAIDEERAELARSLAAWSPPHR